MTEGKKDSEKEYTFERINFLYEQICSTYVERRYSYDTNSLCEISLRCSLRESIKLDSGPGR